MKKSDYEALARAIKDNTPHNMDGSLRNVPRFGDIILYHTFLDDICRILKAENPKFDEVKFRELLK